MGSAMPVAVCGGGLEGAPTAAVVKSVRGGSTLAQAATSARRITVAQLHCWDHVGRNVIHGSDSVESATREIGLWFPEGLAEWTPVAKPWIYE
ncbi:Nucleoside diphosphate kinase 1 [Tetrabaena socialis]|uniref:Nucleoside diphosphate kinase 1 n=1 Tax=Tetrabaena socialis TaxID=47790 RepID=A0A2J8A7G1_9CHLO|nr:Nucleoside diphosphate kinase 1 [Tetrabaena socialis]|eukprot:PNH08461.1 Nucleoside diphosphate kinase 1 [Tetrabaena socialis]